MKLEKNDFRTVCKLIESGINLIVATDMSEIELKTPIWMPYGDNGYSQLIVTTITLTAHTDWSNTPQSIVVDFGGLKSTIDVVADDGEMLWTPLTPLTDRVEKAVEKILADAEMEKTN